MPGYQMRLVPTGNLHHREGTWTDSEFLSLRSSTLSILVYQEQQVGQVLAIEAPSGDAFSLYGTYVSFSDRALQFLSDGQASSEMQDLLLERFNGPILARVASSAPHVANILEVHGFRWCESSEDYRYRILELAQPVNAGLQMSGSSFAVNPDFPTIHLATGSAVKKSQYAHLFRRWGLNTQISNLSRWAYEPQVDGDGTDEERALVEAPLRHIAKLSARANSFPIVVEDTMLFIEHFNRDYLRPLLPGPDTKRWWGALGSDGLLDLMRGSKRRRARFVAQLGISYESGSYQTFRAEVDGFISEQSRDSEAQQRNFPFSNPFNFHNIFVPIGSELAYSEMDPGTFRRHDYRTACVDKAAPSIRARVLGNRPTQVAFDWDEL
ncbi:non-canonical purine NTP pyrophosphatase [Frigoribacterium sp. RIT-PI-h]|uniref:non-canonical purine NTP pyrophosphatase n=1 Tax=Frigoribacterium sp. RIT-PI-h TaxID=1690245 RepID=UPI0009E7093F|nr:non-canonical purine NTP pyrophosphatase [Frigoribacterium sp. RIT-PI-h]